MWPETLILILFSVSIIFLISLEPTWWGFLMLILSENVLYGGAWVNKIIGLSLLHF